MMEEGLLMIIRSLSLPVHDSMPRPPDLMGQARYRLGLALLGERHIPLSAGAKP